MPAQSAPVLELAVTAQAWTHAQGTALGLDSNTRKACHESKAREPGVVSWPCIISTTVIREIGEQAGK